MNSGDTQSDEEHREEEDDEESDQDDESIIMSQRVWDDTDVLSGTGDEQDESTNDSDSEIAEKLRLESSFFFLCSRGVINLSFFSWCFGRHPKSLLLSRDGH